MPIAALSENAARAITSTVALNDAISVIKELIDNSLDSNATNILIEIAANALDVIQVKDNGSGVGVEDRLLLCKRGYTSKIRTFEDLAQLGGTFLGFRGEALSSIAALSQTIQITTRVDGETVGTQLQFDATGKLVSSCSASHGTGTTVRVIDFLKDIPVRRQTALKDSAKILKRIKQLLFKYAFARPTVRFQIKVLKSKSDFKDNWSFVPCKDDKNLALITSKIVGKDIAAQCKQTAIRSNDEQYCLEAFMLGCDSDPGKIGSHDQYCSIDGRPLNTERGFVKELNNIYKSYLRYVLPPDISVPKRVFALLRIKCPNGAYDVNVEPAKDEVMFEDNSKMMELFENLCKQIYGEIVAKSPAHRPQQSDGKNANLNSFELLLSKKSSPEAIVEPNVPVQTELVNMLDHDNQPESTKIAPTAMLPGQTESMYSKPDNDTNICAGESPVIRSMNTEEDDAEGDLMDPRVTNPFTLAKLNTRNRATDSNTLPTIGARHSEQHAVTEISPTLEDGDRITNVPAVTQSRMEQSTSTSPERSKGYQNPGPPNRPWKRADAVDHVIENSSEDDAQSTERQKSQQPTLLDTWKTKIGISSNEMSGGLQSERGPSHDLPSLEATSNRLQRAPGSHIRSTVSPIKQKPFRTPLRNRSSPRQQLQLPSPYPTPATSSSPERRPQVSPSHGPQLPGFSRPEVNLSTELDEIMDFEHRKKLLKVQHRKRGCEPRNDITDGAKEDLELLSTGPLPQRISEASDARGDYAARFSSPGVQPDIPSQPKSASYTQNPHQNRYRKALQNLGQGSDDILRTTHVAQQTKNSEDLQQRHSAGHGQEVPLMSPNDPRAYLIRQRRRPDNTSSTHKQILSRLPFEAIHEKSATYRLLAETEQDIVQPETTLKSSIELLKHFDPYIISGNITPAFDRGHPTESVVRSSEDILHRLIADRVKS